MNELNISTLDLVTEKDVYEHEGKYAVEFPLDGKNMLITGGDPTFIVESANQMIKDENTKNVLKPEYSRAVKTLAVLALTGGGSGSDIAALVLLSCWNGYDYHFSATSLGNLDDEHFEAALTVLRGRIKVWLEPQAVIENGDAIFSQLANKWYHLRVDQQYGHHYEND